ncbi:MAG: DUF721 domain-containing protein [Rickettsiales bacterium]|jgi:hypothetical protein|nr:DUF721 domain-containing protein [Rickettsiales bacterium]
MENKKPDLSVRRARPQTLGSAFGGLMKIFGARASDADLAARWRDIVGPDFASIAKLIGTRQEGQKDKRAKGQNKDKLAIAKMSFCPSAHLSIIIRPINPAFAMELSYRTEELRAKINKYFGYEAVNKITIRK